MCAMREQQDCEPVTHAIQNNLGTLCPSLSLIYYADAEFRVVNDSTLHGIGWVEDHLDSPT